MRANGSRVLSGAIAICLACLACGLLGCRRNDMPRADTRERSVDVAAAPPAKVRKERPRQRQRERDKAILSAYTHALGDPRQLPEGLGVIDLRDAGRILYLQSTESEPDQVRWRYAIMRMTVGELDLQADGYLSETALAFLEATRAPIDAIRKVIARERDKLLPEPHPVPRPVPIVLPPQLIEKLKLVLERAILEMNAWGPLECSFTPVDEPPQGTKEACPATPEIPEDAVVTATSYIEVNQSVDQLRALFDAQNWDVSDDCETFFTNTCALGDDENCLRCEKADCSDCPPAAGSKWDGALWEEFEVEWDPILPNPGNNTSYFSVYLDIDSDPKVNGYRMEYCLDKEGYSRIGNNDSGTIAVDQGYAEITFVDDTSSRIENVKRIRFENWTNESGQGIDTNVNFAAKVMLTGIADATASHACCKAPADKTCATPLGQPVLLP